MKYQNNIFGRILPRYVAGAKKKVCSGAMGGNSEAEATKRNEKMCVSG
jgi:hypothetical protein